MILTYSITSISQNQPSSASSILPDTSLREEGVREVEQQYRMPERYHDPQYKPLKKIALQSWKLTEDENALCWNILYKAGCFIMVLADIGLSNNPIITGGQAVKIRLNMAIVHLKKVCQQKNYLKSYRSNIVCPEKAEKKANHNSMM